MAKAIASIATCIRTNQNRNIERRRYAPPLYVLVLDWRQLYKKKSVAKQRLYERAKLKNQIFNGAAKPRH